MVALPVIWAGGMQWGPQKEPLLWEESSPDTPCLLAWQWEGGWHQVSAGQLPWPMSGVTSPGDPVANSTIKNHDPEHPQSPKVTLDVVHWHQGDYPQ